ncbi:MAG: hypothetical protein KAI76_08320, partial [Alphaproteobacteria bacterium]|nr:hypothetical protein [Alphaproteobacteria bacterium]
MNIKGLQASFLLLLLGVMCIFSNTPAMSENFKNSDLLDFPKSERDAFYTGAAISIGHTISIYDKETGQCYTDWFFENPNKRIMEIEKAVQENPDHTPSTIMLG